MANRFGKSKSFFVKVEIVKWACDFLQTPGADVCVPEGGFQVVVSEQFLNQFYVRSSFVQVRGVTVPDAFAHIKANAKPGK